MGSVIYKKDGFEVKRFWGGQERGVCFQLTTKDGFIQVPREKFYHMMLALVAQTILKISWSDLDKLRDMTEQAPQSLFYRNVKLWCPQIKEMVTLCIETNPKDTPVILAGIKDIVCGKPFSCNLQNCEKGNLCLLSIDRIEVHK